MTRFETGLIPFIRLSHSQKTHPLIFEDVGDAYRFINSAAEHMRRAGIQVKEESYNDLFGKKQVTKTTNLDAKKKQ
jgi:hypothetical protein